MAEVTIPEPQDPPPNATRSQERMWEKRCDEVVKREMHLKENLKTLYSLVWGQCTEAMRAKIKAHATFGRVSQSSDSLELLRIIKDQAFNYQNQKYNFQALHEAKRRFYMLKQDKWMSAQEYLEKLEI